MLSAVIDVGSNTIRLLIGCIKEGRVYRLFFDRAVTRLGESLKETGILKKDNMESSVTAIRRMSEVISRYDVKRIEAVGTAALRNSKNNLDFIEMVFRETGIRIKVITPEEEARLTIIGVLSDLKLGNSLVIDIGGGSTEWIIYNSKKFDRSMFGSMPIGVVNLLEDHIKSDPPSSPEIEALENYIVKHIKESKVYGSLSSDFAANALVGTGGTITTLAAMDLEIDDYKPEIIHGHTIGIVRLMDLKDRLLSVPLSLRRGIKGLCPERADLIIPGIILTIKIMDIFNFSELLVSDYGLLEGLLLEGGKYEEGF